MLDSAALNFKNPSRPNLGTGLLHKESLAQRMLGSPTNPGFRETPSPTVTPIDPKYTPEITPILNPIQTQVRGHGARLLGGSLA